jgi:hypothetical protein
LKTQFLQSPAVAVAVAVAVATAVAEMERLLTLLPVELRVHLECSWVETAAVLVAAAAGFAAGLQVLVVAATTGVLAETPVKIWFRQHGLVHMSAPHRGLLCSPMRQCRTTLWLQPCHRWCRQQLTSRQIPALGQR